MKYTHIAFGDETNHTAGSGRYGAVALLTMPLEIARSLHKQLSDILKINNLAEFKWQRIKERKHKQIAVIFINTVIEEICKKNLRIDTLSWDYHDTRHNVQNRDDIANFHRMYHHLLNNVLKNKWPDNLTWKLCPDENSAVNWNEVKYFLQNKSVMCESGHDLFSDSKVSWRNLFQICEIAQLDSRTTPLIQITDLFAGLSAYSRENYLKINQWLKNKEQTPDLFSLKHETVSFSKNDKVRCEIIWLLKNKCDKYKLGVSLTSAKGLKTCSPNNPINFWWYTPQHDNDKAPTKKK